MVSWFKTIGPGFGWFLAIESYMALDDDGEFPMASPESYAHMTTL